MRIHFRIGKMFGAPIGLNWGVVAVSVLLVVSLAMVSLPTAAPRYPTSAYWFGGVIGMIGFLVSLLAHELGHGYIAHRNNVRVMEITLWLFGGVAKLEGDADNPGAEFRIAAAGPAMSFVMAAIFGVAAWLVNYFDGLEVLFVVAVWLSAINVILAVSNLLPAYPLDGGRMLRAVIWRRTGLKMRASRLAGLWGQILGGILIATAALVWWRMGFWTGFWILLFAAFIVFGARSEWNYSKPRPEMLQWEVGGLARTVPEPMRPQSSVADLEALLVASPGTPLVPVIDDHGQIVQMVWPDTVYRVPPAQRHVVPIGSYAEPLMRLPRVHADESLEAVLRRVGDGQYWRALIHDDDGNVRVLCSEDVESFIELAALK